MKGEKSQYLKKKSGMLHHASFPSTLHLEEAASYGIQQLTSLKRLNAFVPKVMLPMSTHVYTFNTEVDRGALDEHWRPRGC